MKDFKGFATNGEYSVGCTGQTVYLYDKDGNEIKKFKDIIYAYTPMISPDGKIFVAKSTDGRLAVYSLETFSLIKKFRFSKVNGAQDDGFCFSPDSKFFINVERQNDDLHSAISFYDTEDFSLVDRFAFGEDLMTDYIEYDEMTDSYYVLGFKRNDHIFTHGFVSKFESGQLTNLTPLSKNEYDFYFSYMYMKQAGFTTRTFGWNVTDCDIDELIAMNHTLAKIYAHYNK